MEKDRKKRSNFLKYESSRKVLKSINHNLSLPKIVRMKAGFSLSALPKNSALTQVKRRCILTGRGRFILGQFNLSRLMLRKLAFGGLIPGLRKSSW